MYTTKEMETIRNDFEQRGMGIKNIYTENGALVIEWANAKQTGKEKSVYYKMA